jgi:hypothetical protein
MKKKIALLVVGLCLIIAAPTARADNEAKMISLEASINILAQETDCKLRAQSLEKVALLITKLIAEGAITHDRSKNALEAIEALLKCN